MRDANYTIQREKAYLAFQYSTNPDQREEDLREVLTLIEIMRMEVEMMIWGSKRVNSD